MRLNTESKQRNVDPFELQIFQEDQSSALKEYRKLLEADMNAKELDQVSKAPSTGYKAFSQQKTGKNKKPKKREVTSLPRYI